MSKVGICNQCNNTAIAGCCVETNDESVVLEDMDASNDTGPVQFDTENEQSSTSAVFRALETTTNSSSKGTDIQVPDKRKQWTREQKLEFIDLYKKYKNKAKAAREFKARYKFEVKATTSCKNSGDTSPSLGVINSPIISHTAAPLPPLSVLLARQKNVGNLSSQH